MSLTQIVVQVLEAAHADAEQQTARDARLDALAARLEDQATMVLELTEAVRGLIARWDSVARPPTTHPVSVHNGGPAFETVPLTPVAQAAPAAPRKRLPRPSDVDRATLLDRYLREKGTNQHTLAAEYGMHRTVIGDWLRAEAERRGPTTVSAYRRVSREKRVLAVQAQRAAVRDQLGRTQPPGATP